MKAILPVFNIAMGIAIYGVWMMDIASRKYRGAFFKWREGENVMWPHLIAEFLTAAALILSGVGTLLKSGWAEVLIVVALGSLFYASLDALSWTPADKKRWPYSVFMLIGLAGSLTFITIIITELVR